MKIRKFNGSSWVQEYPEVRHTDIVASGTPSSSNFLRGDGAWANVGDGNTKFYAWRAIDNTSSGGAGYYRIANINGQASTRFHIEITGRSQGYGDGNLPNYGKILGQYNNDNNYDVWFFNNRTGTSEVVEEVGTIDDGTNNVDIWVKVSSFAEVTATAYISDGTITTYGDDSETSTEPTGYSAVGAEYIMWNSGNDGSGSGLAADTVDGIHGGSFLRSDTADTATGDITFTGNIVADGDIRSNSPANNIAPINVKSLSNGRAIHIEETGAGTESYQIGVDTAGNLNFMNSGSGTPNVRFMDDDSVVMTGSLTIGGSEALTRANRDDIYSFHDASDLAVGWYTIAVNTGDRAIGKFGLRDTDSSRHQSVIFYAAHHFGNDDSNTITVLHNSRFGTSPLRKIRIKDGGTYEGAALQIYIDNAQNNLRALILGDNFQSSGWVLRDWIADATDPGFVDNWSSFTSKGEIDLDQIDQGGIATTGPMYAGTNMTQYRVLTTDDEGSGNGIDADTVDGLQASSFIRSDATDTATGQLTFSGQLYLTGGSNQINGHHYFTPYDANGNHYPHYKQGSNSNGAQVNMRVQDQNGTYQVFYIDGDSNDMTWRGNKIWNAGNDGASSGLDADLLDGQQGSYYLDYNNFTNTPTIPTGDITGVTAGTGLSGGGTSGTVTLNLDLSEFTDMTDDVNGLQDEMILLDNGAERRKLLSEIKLSQFNNDSGFASGDITNLTAGDGLTGGGSSGSVTVSHADTSSQSSVNNSGNTFIQDITLDTYGHITGITSATASTTDSTKLPLAGGTMTGDLTLDHDGTGTTADSHGIRFTARAVNTDFTKELLMNDAGQLEFDGAALDTDTVTSIRRDNTGTYRTGNINLVGGSGVSISETNPGVFSFSTAGGGNTWTEIKSGSTTLSASTSVQSITTNPSYTLTDTSVIAFEINTGSVQSYTSEIKIVKLENSDNSSAGIPYNAYISTSTIRHGAVRVYRGLNSFTINFRYANYHNNGSSSEVDDQIYIGKIWLLGVTGA